MNNVNKAIIFVLVANTIWASAGLLVRMIDLTGTQIQFMTGVFGMITLLIYASVTKKLHLIKEIKFSKINLLYIFLCAHLGVMIFNAFSDKNFPIGATNLILNSSPFLIVIFAPLLIKENSTAKHFLFAILGLVGLFVFIISQQGGLGNITFSVGLLLSLGALVFNSFSSLVNRKISSNANELTIPFLTLLGNILIAPVYIVIFRETNFNFSTQNIFYSVILASTSSFLGFFLISKGYKFLKAQVISILNLIQPVITAILGYLFLAEKFNLFMIFGGIIILASTLGIVLDKEEE